MLFNSYSFICVFMPIAIAGYYFSSRLDASAAAAWLLACSLAFYGYWNLHFVPLLIVSIIVNFSIGQTLLHKFNEEKNTKVLLSLGIIANILPLFYFKYFKALADSFFPFSGVLPDGSFDIVLPLGISFFTFTQIGYLVDCAEGEGKELGLLRYALFVSFFPHLAAGPLLHVREIGPQLLRSETFRLREENLAYGMTYFVIGLSKKVLLADTLSRQVSLGFLHPAAFGCAASWAYVLAYSLQLYFDFSGYSDMAIALAAIFGIKFPLNFNSPYKATCIIDFWQRWHMTLTRYLNLLLFNPIALRATRRRLKAGLPLFRSGAANLGAFFETVATPIFITMILAGIWHGAGLQFVVFGLLHAGYLTINHAWRGYFPVAPARSESLVRRLAVTIVFGGVTYLAVLVGQIFFRAASVEDALALLSGMVGLHGFEPPPSDDSVPSAWGLAWRFGIVWLLPNSQRIMELIMPMFSDPRPLLARPRLIWSVAAGGLLGYDLLMLEDAKVFLYFQF
jgi:alginate O-acetyltransferase complex protein AlgI